MQIRLRELESIFNRANDLTHYIQKYLLLCKDSEIYAIYIAACLIRDKIDIACTLERENTQKEN